MSVKSFERDAIIYLTRNCYWAAAISDIFVDNLIWELDFSAMGYFLSLSDPRLPNEREVFDGPVAWRSGEYEGGFLVIVQKRNLTLECYTWLDSIPKNFRDLDVKIEYPRNP